MCSVPTSKAHNSLVREVLLLLPFYGWRNRGPERWRNRGPKRICTRSQLGSCRWRLSSSWLSNLHSWPIWDVVLLQEVVGVLLSALLKSLLWLPSRKLSLPWTSCLEPSLAPDLILVLFHGTCLVSPLHGHHPEVEANSGSSSHTQQNAFTSILMPVISSFFLSATPDRSWSFLFAFSQSPLHYADYFISCGFHLFFFLLLSLGSVYSSCTCFKKKGILTY